MPIAMPEADASVLARRSEIVAALRAIVPGEGVIDSAAEMMPYESDGLTAYLPADADVKAGDRIEYAGEVYTINGAPRVWPSASGGLDHIQLNLERWSG